MRENLKRTISRTNFVDARVEELPKNLAVMERTLSYERPATQAVP